MVIDVFSKFTWVVATKNKTAKSVVKAFKRIFNATRRRPYRIQADRGREFVNKDLKGFLKQHNIIFNTTNNEVKCAVVERVIRTLKARIFKYLYFKNSFRYIDALQSICNAYNNCYHRSIKMAPASVNDDNVLVVYSNLRSNIKDSSNTQSKYKIDDYVRISKIKGVFEKGYSPSWSEEIFQIKSVIESTPVVYKIADLQNEEVEGNFYEQEIQKVFYDEQAVFAIEKIIDQKRVRGSTQYLVKWRGWPNKFNSWVDESTVQNI